jgi:formylglycine-generating enzyme required for sulfatase activity
MKKSGILSFAVFAAAMSACLLIIAPVNAQLSLKIKLSSPEHGEQEFSYELPEAIIQISDETYTVGDVSFTMKAVIGGTFNMGAQSSNSGSANYDNDAISHESPVHSVTLSDFSIGETEVTQALWKAVMGSNPSLFQSSTNVAYANRENYPVEKVSWNDIVGTNTSDVGYIANGITYYKDGFCYKLSQLLGGDKKFRLPTEAEWEYASRGGSLAESQTKYSGSNNINDVGWCLENIPSSSNGTSGYGTQAVKSKQANALGLYDMSGNVAEWCSDWYGSAYSSENQTNPTGVSTGSVRVLRGGVWGDYARNCRVSNRYAMSPTARDSDDGLRLVIGSN